MNPLGATRRFQTESRQSMVVFAQVRLALALATVLAAGMIGLPEDGTAAAVIAVAAVPWSLLNLFLARNHPDVALSPLIALGDVAMLAIIQLVLPEAYGAVRFLALALLAVHAHFQGERIGAAAALFGVAALAIPNLLQDPADRGLDGDRLAVYEVAFAAAALMTVALIGRFREEESASRLRARELTRRTLRGENEIRRKLSQALHDGPVQELIGLDMTLSAATAAVARGDQGQATELLREAGEITQRNVRSLRDEMLDLGPYAYDEISFEAAVERCRGVWERRFQIRTEMDIEPLDLPSELEGELFRITQEAVSNAGRHAEAHAVKISLTGRQGAIELRVTDDGKGFGDVDPLGATEVGHIGLASMRERAELMRGTLRIGTGDSGTEVKVTAPHPRRGRFGLRQRARKGGG